MDERMKELRDGDNTRGPPGTVFYFSVITTRWMVSSYRKHVLRPLCFLCLFASRNACRYYAILAPIGLGFTTSEIEYHSQKERHFWNEKQKTMHRK